ncbi:hypothetical protein CU098_006789 [Rhizopus stolonifer]|uniref:Uncharacterized protein n=1 Tax=Rhizopus stolonifer TaxID=4846 RepID=A0A367JBE4_RHIST|nr:hypothetical protein CU098_006789 [Rhizopus stolonifer]
MTLGSTDFLLKCSTNSNLTITDFYESNGILFEDRYSVEKLTKETIAQILNESTGYSVVLGEICNVLLAGDYLALRTESCERYWEEKKSIGNIRRSRREQINADIEKRESKRLKSKNVFPNEQDTILAGFEKSVASMIKYHAHQTHMNKKYSELDNYAKNSVSNGFNSILDLTENNVHPLNQKAIFTDEQWKQLNHAWNKRINWNPIKGKVNKLNLVDNGLYVATKLGSLRLPTSGIELRKARTLIERLFTLKRDAKYLANCHTMLSNETAAALKSMDRKQNNSRSPYDEEQDKEKKIDHYCNWVRGSWFPPSQKKDKPYYGQYPTSLFQ